jgi:hypothetical protein
MAVSINLWAFSLVYGWGNALVKFWAIFGLLAYLARES